MRSICTADVQLENLYLWQSKDMLFTKFRSEEYLAMLKITAVVLETQV